MLQWIRTISRMLTTGVLLSIVFVAPGNGQSTSDPEEGSESEETIEEILVYGSKSLNRLRLDVYEAQDAVFDLFNELNSDDQFDVQCYRERPTGSSITQRVCKPNYARQLEGEAATQWHTSEQARTGQQYHNPSIRIRMMDKRLREEMARLVAQDPELLEAMEKFLKSEDTLEAERKRRCEDRIILCR